MVRFVNASTIETTSADAHLDAAVGSSTVKPSSLDGENSADCKLKMLLVAVTGNTYTAITVKEKNLKKMIQIRKRKRRQNLI